MKHTQYLRSRRGGWAFGVCALATFVVIGAGRALAECDTSICGTSPCTVTGTHTIDSGCTLDFGTKDVILTGTLQGDNNAACYTVKSHDFTVRGTLRARGSCVVADVTGTFKTEIVSNSNAMVDTRAADSVGDGASITAADVVLNGRDVTADGASGFDGGDISIHASNSVTGSGTQITIHAAGGLGGNGGTIDIAADTGAINLPCPFDASGAGTLGYGGSISLDGGTSVTAGGSNKNLQAQGQGDGDGGSVDIIARAGTATVNGTINVNGNGDFAFGGDVSVEGSAVSTGTAWNARGDQSGFGGSIAVTALPVAGGGTITTTSGTASFNSTGGAGGGDGGDIDLDANGSITLAGDMDATGQGELASAGSITIIGGTRSSDTVTIQSTSRIESDSSGVDASDGLIDVEGCNVSIAGILDTRNTSLTDGFGSNDITYRGTLTTTSGSSLLADNAADGGENDLRCRCVDTSPADGVCDTPATCVNTPSLAGTVNPTATIIPTALAACS